MSFTNTWNIARQLAAFPCAEPDPVIIALTFLPAVAPALLEWVSFGCRDILKFRLGKGTPCGRQMKAQVAKAVPPSLASSADFLLKWEHRFSYAGQMFLLADLISDTLARWDTLAYQLSGCAESNEMASWQVEYNGPEALLPGVATPIGGVIRNEKGRPGVAWPNGAIVPRGWYFQANFEVTAVPPLGGGTIGLTTFIRKEDHGTYDFPGNKYPRGYPGESKTGHYMMTTQAPDRGGSTFYTFRAIADQFGVTTNMKATCQASLLAPSDWTLNPLGCLRDLGVENIDNPANRNRRSRYPTQLDKWLKDILPKPVHGPPKGKPRTIN